MALEGIESGNYVDRYAKLANGGLDGVGNTGDTIAVKELAPLIAEALNISVTHEAGRVTATDAKGNVILDVPELEESELGEREVDLAALVAYLQMEDTEKQLEVAKKRIEVTKGRIEANHESTLAKCEESIEKARESEAKSKRTKRLGKFAMFLTLILGLVVAGVTMGPAGVAAVLVVAGAFIALQKTGANEKLAELASEGLEKLILGFCDAFGIELSEKDKHNIELASKIIGTLTVVGVELVVSLLVMHKLPKQFMKLGSSKFGTSFAKHFPKLAGKLGAWQSKALALGGGALAAGTIAIDASMIAVAVLNTSAEIMTAKSQRDSQLTQAELKELQSYLRELQSRLQDDEEAVQMLLDLLFNYADQAAEILDSQAEVDVAITQQIA